MAHSHIPEEDDLYQPMPEQNISKQGSPLKNDDLAPDVIQEVAEDPEQIATEQQPSISQKEGGSVSIPHDELSGSAVMPKNLAKQSSQGKLNNMTIPTSSKNSLQ